MAKMIIISLVVGCLIWTSAHAGDKKTRNAALVGAGLGLVTDGGAGAVAGRHKDKK